MMQRIRWFLLIVTIVVVVVFSFYNTENVTVKLPILEDHDLPLALLLIVTAAIGFVFGAIMTGWMLRGSSKSKKVEAPKKESESKSDSTSTSSVFPETT